MLRSKFVALVALTVTVAGPVLAAAPQVSGPSRNAASSLSLGSLHNVRVASKSPKKSNLLGLPLIALIGLAAAATAAVVVAADSGNNNNSSSS